MNGDRARTLSMGGMQGRGDPPLRRHNLRAWRLTFSVDGAIFAWSGTAPNLQMAEQAARADLTADCPAFHGTARLVACLEG